MKRNKPKFLVSMLLCVAYSISFADDSNRDIVNGVPWFDTDGNIVNAHGACIVEDGGKYWLFGEYKSDESNAFPGFGCYSSTDLVNWKFERVVLPVQPDGILGPDRVGERVKVMRCPKTGEYVMLMHADNMKYSDPHIGIAVSDSINGDYRLLGTIEYEGKPIKKWDMGTFQDEDGSGYLLIHHGPIYKLSDDYRSIVEKSADIKGMGESPAMFKKDGIYYLLTSNLTSWERNDNYYFTSTDIRGSWEKQGLFCPEGSLTYNSQCTFVFPLRHGDDTVPMYMGDRWSYPHQASAATYVWLPMTTEGTKLSIPEYWERWNTESIKESEIKGYVRHHDWTSDKKGESIRIPFHGERITIFGNTDNISGYARVRIIDRNGNEISNSLVDFYSKVPSESSRYMSRILPEGDYTLVVENEGIMPVWYKKNGDRFGSTGYKVNISHTITE
ncbi:MAG: family 43 glycosylhydrolase [Muribaculaceae bacterium]|nr:family 43 glycosylhydrolase [Muribaculaceae bacterium]